MTPTTGQPVRFMIPKLRVDDQVVVPEGRAGSQRRTFHFRFRKFFDDVSHLMGGKKLSFLTLTGRLVSARATTRSVWRQRKAGVGMPMISAAGLAWWGS